MKTSIALPMLFVAAPTFAHETVPGEFLVRAKRDTSGAFATEATAAKTLGAKSVRRVPASDLLLVERPTVETDAAGLRALLAHPLVAKVEPNYVFRIHALPNDPLLEKLWGLHNTGQRDGSWVTGTAGVDIQAARAWDITQGSSDVVVAVIDTGIELDHQDLRDNLWVNEKEAAGLVDTDDDGNGFIDDIHGWDFANDDMDPNDDHNHGTHVAGTIGARGNDGYGVVGVAWTARLMAIKAFDSRGSGTTANAVAAINYATLMKARIMNNSWGGEPPSDFLREAIERSEKAGALFIASAGNSRANNDVAPQYPASFQIANVVSVAAVNNRGELASFSNRGRKSVHVAAPGASIFSTVRGGHGSMSGTSMASPHVSGIAALVLARNPSLTYAQVKQRMMDATVPLPELRGKTITEGIVSAAHAISGEKAPPPADHPSRWENTRALAIATAHPYSSDTNQEWEIHEPGAKAIALYFEKFETEDPYDAVTIYNSQGTRVEFLTGTEGEGWTIPYSGDRLRIVFRSDARNNFHGFDLTKAAFR